MECSKSRTKNPKGHLFFRECGVKLGYPCPGCDTEVVPGDKFCGNCGRNLQSKTTPTELSFEDKLANSQKYLPGGLTEKSWLKKEKSKGERKQVTVLFADMKNFTPWSTSLRLNDRKGGGAT